MIDKSIGYPKRPIIQMDLEGKAIKEFQSIKEAAKQFGGKSIDFVKIRNAANIFHTNSDATKGEKTLKQGIKLKTRKAKNEAFGYLWQFKEQ